MDTVYELDKSQEEWLERIVSKELGGSQEREENFHNSSILLTPVEENGDVDADLTALSDLITCDISIPQQPEDCTQSQAASTDGSLGHKIPASSQQGDGEDDREGEIRLRCRYCRFTACSVKDVEDHVQRHVRRGSIRYCPFCEYASASKVMLTEHIAWHTNSKPFKCRYCSYRNRLCSEVYYHQAKHKAEKKFKCRLCNFRTKWRKNISHHHTFVHTQTRPFKCDICSMAFKRAYDLKFHKFRHNDIKPFCCEECQFRCKTKFELHMHQLKHSDQRYFACTFPGCPQWTKTKSDLTKHMKVHKEVRDFICSLCGKGFKCKGDLQRHLERHTVERRFTCGTCLKAFKTRGTLRAHIAGHSGARPFVCTICGFRFRSKNNMKSHFKTHQGDRPYRCPICPYWAKQFYDLLAHIGVAHGNRYTYYCELCRKPFARLGQLKKHFGCEHPGIDPLKNPSVKTEGGEETEQTNTVAMVEVDGRPGYTIKGETFSESDNWRDYVVKREESQNDGENGWGQLILPLEAGQQDQGSLGNRTVHLGDLVKREAIEPISVIATYGECRLPLATQGFEFNLNKTGKKPKKWFMQPEHMRPADAQRQRRYLIRRERETVKRQGGIIRVAQKHKTGRKPALRKSSQRSVLDKLWREKNPAGFEISQLGKSIVQNLRREVGLGRGRRKSGVLPQTLSHKSGGLKTGSGIPAGAKLKEVSGAASNPGIGKRSRAPPTWEPRKQLTTEVTRNNAGMAITRSGSTLRLRGPPSRPANNNHGRDLGLKTPGPRPKGRPRKRPASDGLQVGPGQKSPRLTKNTSDDHGRDLRLKTLGQRPRGRPRKQPATVGLQVGPGQKSPRLTKNTSDDHGRDLRLKTLGQRPRGRPRKQPATVGLQVGPGQKSPRLTKNTSDDHGRDLGLKTLGQRPRGRPRKQPASDGLQVGPGQKSPRLTKNTSDDHGRDLGLKTLGPRQRGRPGKRPASDGLQVGPGSKRPRLTKNTSDDHGRDLGLKTLGQRPRGRPRKQPATVGLQVGPGQKSPRLTKNTSDDHGRGLGLKTLGPRPKGRPRKQPATVGLQVGPGQKSPRLTKNTSDDHGRDLGLKTLGQRPRGRPRKQPASDGLQVGPGQKSPRLTKNTSDDHGRGLGLKTLGPRPKGRPRKQPASDGLQVGPGQKSPRLTNNTSDDCCDSTTEDSPQAYEQSVGGESGDFEQESLPGTAASSSLPLHTPEGIVRRGSGGGPRQTLKCPPRTPVTLQVSVKDQCEKKPLVIQAKQKKAGRPSKRLLAPLLRDCHLVKGGRAGCLRKRELATRSDQGGASPHESRRKKDAGRASHCVSPAEAERSPDERCLTQSLTPRKHGRPREERKVVILCSCCRAKRSKTIAFSREILCKCLKRSVQKWKESKGPTLCRACRQEQFALYRKIIRKYVNKCVKKPVPPRRYGKLGPAYYFHTCRYGKLGPAYYFPTRKVLELKGVDIEAARRSGANISLGSWGLEVDFAGGWQGTCASPQNLPAGIQTEQEVMDERPGNTSPPTASRACDVDVLDDQGCSQGHGGLSSNDQSNGYGTRESPGFRCDYQALHAAYQSGARESSPLQGCDEFHPVMIEHNVEYEAEVTICFNQGSLGSDELHPIMIDDSEEEVDLTMGFNRGSLFD